MLYKYCNAKVGFENILTNATLKWTHPQEFNDPFDCQCQLLFGRYEAGTDLVYEMETAKKPITQRLTLTTTLAEKLNNGMDELVNSEPFLTEKDKFFKILDNSGIFCLTKESKNILMWSHYADNHKGLCFGFSSEGLTDSIFNLAEPVIYTAKYPKILMDDFRENYTEKLINMYTLTKFEDWSYEREWRIILHINSGEERIKKFDPQELRQVILGAKIESSDATAIRKLVKEKYPHVKIFQANIVQGSFELDVTELTS